MHSQQTSAQEQLPPTQPDFKQKAQSRASGAEGIALVGLNHSAFFFHTNVVPRSLPRPSHR